MKSQGFKFFEYIGFSRYTPINLHILFIDANTFFSGYYSDDLDLLKTVSNMP